MKLTKRQGVKINAALSLIYSQGYDAQTVVGWAREFQRQGYPVAKSYERALNEFIGGQPEFEAPLGKITRLVQASDEPTLAKYETALASYIETGDGSALTALAPMIASDSVELARREGELPNGAINADAVEAAIGLPMGERYVQAAAQSAPQQAAQPLAFQTAEPAPAPLDPKAAGSQVSPFAAGGWSSRREKFESTPNTGSLGPVRTLLQGRGGNAPQASAPATGLEV